MAQLLVRHLNDDVVKRLKQRAREHGRSLQSEAKTILEEAVPDYEAAWKRIERFRKRLQQPPSFERVVIGEPLCDGWECSCLFHP